MKQHRVYKPYNPARSRLTMILVALGIVGVLIPGLIAILPQPGYQTGMEDLPALVAYAASVPEQYALDNDNTIKPAFNKIYAQDAPTWQSNYADKFRWLGSKLHVVNPPLWSPSFFRKQIVSLAKKREAAGMKGDFIAKLTTSPKSKIFYLGNIHGALHSLVRCLQELKKLGAINDNLTITNPDYFIVFIGNTISRSPYCMQTLSMVCRLVEKNPEQVIYLRGGHESKNYWQEQSLKTQLQVFAKDLGRGTIPLADEVNALFNTLPLAAYVMATEEDNQCIRFSDVGRTQDERLTEAQYASFLTAKSDAKVAYHHLDKKDANPPAIKVSVIFKGEKKRETYQPHDGLRLLEPDMDSVAWTALSCPTILYQKAIKFFFDAFSVIIPGTKLADWTITLYNRDVRTTEPFKATTFNLLTGQNTSSDKKQMAPAQPTKKPAPEQASTPSPRNNVQQDEHTSPTISLDTAITSTIQQLQVIQEQAQACIQALQEARSEPSPTTRTPAVAQTPQKAPPNTTKPVADEEVSAFEPIP